MDPIEFKEQNVVFAKDQPQYRPLPALIKPGPEGEVVSCWGLSFRERIRVLFTGRIWVSLWSFMDISGNLNPLTPSRLTTVKQEMIPQDGAILVDTTVKESDGVN